MPRIVLGDARTVARTLAAQLQSRRWRIVPVLSVVCVVALTAHPLSPGRLWWAQQRLGPALGEPDDAGDMDRATLSTIERWSPESEDEIGPPYGSSKRWSGGSILDTIGRWWGSLFKWHGMPRSYKDEVVVDDAASDQSSRGDGLGGDRVPDREFIEDTVKGVKLVYTPLLSDTRSVALLFHGCQQDALDWFELPAHRLIVRELRARGIAAIAFTSRNQISRCWSTRFPSDQNIDTQRVALALRYWRLEHNVTEDFRFYGIGFSSGATMLSVLATEHTMPFIVSQALYMSPGNMRAFRRASEDYPSTLFVRQMEDVSFATHRAVEEAHKVLLDRGTQFVGELPLSRPQLMPASLRDRDPRFTLAQSHEMYRLLSGTRRGFTQTLRQLHEETDLSRLSDVPSRRHSLQCFARELDGKHELSSKHADKVISWLIQHGASKESDDSRHDGPRAD